jgi:hypothetical protein
MDSKSSGLAGTMWLQHNQERDTVLHVFKETRFTEFMSDNRLDRGAFIKAIRLAPSIKPGYQTVLSEPGAVEKLCDHVANDPFWDAYLR